MKLNPILKSDNITLRLLTSQDLDAYYEAAFLTADPEVDRLTGTTQTFTKEMTRDYLFRIENDSTRYDFLISCNEQMKGEVVLNEIEGTHAGFRICLFNIDSCNHGIGSEAMRLVIDFAFKTLDIEEIELEVLAINPRAKHVYEKIGFRQTEILKNEYHLPEGDIDAIVMTLKRK